MKEKICIVCPRGCMMKYEEDGSDLKVYENACARGPEYLKQEITEPKRMLTTTMKIKGGDTCVVPVHAKEYVNKDEVFEIIKYLKSIELQAPVECDQLIIDNINGKPIEILTSKEVKENTN